MRSEQESIMKSYDALRILSISLRFRDDTYAELAAAGVLAGHTTIPCPPTFRTLGTKAPATVLEVLAGIVPQNVYSICHAAIGCCLGRFRVEHMLQEAKRDFILDNSTALTHVVYALEIESGITYCFVPGLVSFVSATDQAKVYL